MREDFTSIGDVLEGSLPANSRFKYALKMSTLFGFWAQIVGKKFEKSSKPITIKFAKLHIACENSYIAQELGLFKTDLLKKISTYSTPLGLRIDDLVFSTSGWNTLKAQVYSQEPRAKAISKEELLNVPLDESELQAVKENIEKLTFLSPEQKKKYYSDITYTMRAKKLRDEQKLVQE